MSILQRTDRNRVRTSVVESITDVQRRRILDDLLDRSSPLALDDLAERLAAAERADESESGDDAEEDVAAHRVVLVHGHLPALEAADLVEWDRDAGTVTATDHPALRDPGLRRILDGAYDGMDDVLDSLTVEERWTALSVLDELDDDPTPRRTLAREVAGRGFSCDPSPDEVEETLAALHHRHLPKLDDAGLLEYDLDEGTVTYRGHPELAP